MSDTPPSPWWAEPVAVFRKAAYGTLAAGLIAGAASYLTGTWDAVQALLEYPEVSAREDAVLRDLIGANAAQIDRNALQINRLTVPTDIFEISDRSGPVRGYCVEGVDCAHNIRVRRTVQGIACELVAGRVPYYYRNPRTNERHDLDVVQGSPRDVGTGPVWLTFTFTTPFGVQPGAEMCTRPAYVNCPGMSPDDDPISPDEECYEVEIRSAP